ERLRARDHRQRRQRARLQPAEEVADAPGDARPERDGGGYQLLDGAGRGDRVELVRVVEDGGFGRARRACVVVACDRVEQLRTDVRLEGRGAILDEPQAEMDVAEQPALVGLAGDGSAAELERPAGVVDERG